MARKRSRTAVLKRQREVKKSEKQALKREKRELRGDDPESDSNVAGNDHEFTISLQRDDGLNSDQGGDEMTGWAPFTGQDVTAMFVDPHVSNFKGQPVTVDSITVSDGETRVIGAGEVFLAEDVTGKGHLSKAVDGKPRHCIFVPID